MKYRKIHPVSKKILLAVVTLSLTVCFAGGSATLGKETEKRRVSLDVFNPTGAVDVTNLHASRIPELEEETVCLLSVHMWEAERILPKIKSLLEDEYPNAKVVPHKDLPNLYGVEKDVLMDAIKQQGCDAAILGNAG